MLRLWGIPVIRNGFRLITLMLATSLFPALSPAQSNDDEALVRQRTKFLEVKTALEKGGDPAPAIPSELEGYPLYPYLVYAKLRSRMGQQTPASIREFLTHYADTPLAPPLRVAWLRFLAAQGRWKDYLAFYQGSRSASLRCHYHYAQLKSGRKKEAWKGAQALWQVGRSQHEACNPLFAAWEKAGGISAELRRKRIELALQAGQISLADYLVGPLGKADRAWVDLWQKVHHNPVLVSSSEQLRADDERTRTIVSYGLRRLADDQPDKAAELWPALAKRYSFTTAQQREITHTIAMEFAFQGDERSLGWFKRLTGKTMTNSERTWAVRMALRHQQWKDALAWLEGLPQSKRKSTVWLYWQARAHEALNNKQKAKELYQAVSTDRSYYGFLAADRLGVAYNLSNDPLEVDDKAVEQLKQQPAVVRARELYSVGLFRKARIEWDHATSRMDRAQRLAAGKLADSWQWHDRALLTLAKAGYFDDLRIRFPLCYNDTMVREAESHALDPSWVYAVARQESAMIPDARSSAGALGLMQLMPQTGRAVAEKLDSSLDDLQQLLHPETNIRFGTYYLHEIMDEFDHNPVLATAAYNAGPHRVRDWYPEKGGMDADIWIDTMPFWETREYVRRVLAYSVFYDHRLNRDKARMSQRMPPIGGPPGTNDCNDSDCMQASAGS